MDRRVSGGLILVMALVVALVVPKILNPPRVDGVAAVVPPPPPPAVGDCVRDPISSLAITETGAFMSWEPVVMVSCAEDHAGEVVYSEAMPESGSGYATTLREDFELRCQDRLQSAWRSSDGWQPAVSAIATVVGPDQKQFGAGQRWAACLASTMDGRRSTHAAGAILDDQPPPEFGLCGNEVTDETWSSPVYCGDPHTIETFGFRAFDVGSQVGQDDLDQSCGALVAGATGRSALTADIVLAVTARVTVWYDSDRPTTDTLPVPADAAGAWAECSIHTTDDRELVGSLRQLGDGPLPWAE